MEHSAPRASSLNALRLQSSSGLQAAVRALFLQAGIEFDGGQPFDIQVRHPRVFDAIARSGSLGFGESYMAGDWECAQLDEMACRLLAARLDQKPIGAAQFRLFAHRLRSRMINLQSLALVAAWAFSLPIDQAGVRSLVFVGLVASGLAIVTANLLGDRPAYDLVRNPNAALLVISCVTVGLLLPIFLVPGLRTAFHFAAVTPLWFLAALAVGWFNYAMLRIIQKYLKSEKFVTL